MMTQSRCQRPPRGRPAQTFRWGFFFSFPSRAEDTQVVGAAVRLSPPQLVGEDHVGGSFSEESPSDISEVASVLEDDNVDLAVEHGRDREGLSFTGLQEHTTQASHRF